MPLCAERRVSALLPVPIHNPDHELLFRTPQKHSTLSWRYKDVSCLTVESSPRPPRRRGKPTTKNGEENKHSDSPDLVDDTQTVGPSTGDVQREEPPRPLESISHGEIISFDRSTRSEADGIQWKGTLRAPLFLRPSIFLIR